MENVTEHFVDKTSWKPGAPYGAPAKFKGIGVALYIHNSLNASTLHDLCKTADHFESHFLTATLGSYKVTIGVTYNLPSGEDKQFLVELTKTLKKCPKHNLYLIGDFNFDLLTLATEDSKTFEELITSHGLFPLISKVTHTRPNCRGTCIDNILTTELIKVNLTGTIEARAVIISPLICIRYFKTFS